MCYREIIRTSCIVEPIVNMSLITSTRIRAVIWAWGPPLALMLAIFIASAQPKNAPPAGSESSVYVSGVMPIFPGGWDALIKKSAHVITYGGLALLTLRALRLHGVPPREAAYLAIVLAVSYALTDELHQSFVTGRRSSVIDIGFDYIGAVCASLAARYIIERRAKTTTPPGNQKRSSCPAESTCFK
jgi:VanZ family protein